MSVLVGALLTAGFIASGLTFAVFAVRWSRREPLCHTLGDISKADDIRCADAMRVLNDLPGSGCERGSVHHSPKGSL